MVSILVVLDHWFGRANAVWWIERYWFQSLLFWIIGSGVAFRFMNRGDTDVSILVVLDHWFGRKAISEPDCMCAVSILVVLDHWFGP